MNVVSFTLIAEGGQRLYALLVELVDTSALEADMK